MATRSRQSKRCPMRHWLDASAICCSWWRLSASRAARTSAGANSLQYACVTIVPAGSTSRSRSRTISAAFWGLSRGRRGGTPAARRSRAPPTRPAVRPTTAPAGRPTAAGVDLTTPTNHEEPSIPVPFTLGPDAYEPPATSPVRNTRIRCGRGVRRADVRGGHVSYVVPDAPAEMFAVHVAVVAGARPVSAADG